MIIGTRVVHPDEVRIWDAELLQISVYRGKKNNLDLIRRCAEVCRKTDIRYVVHPVSYFVLDKGMLKDLMVMAEYSDLALILHDERTPEGERVEGPYEKSFRKAIEELNSITHISFENAINTRDVQWFWNRYAESITLDIGHVEAAGLDSVEFVKSLEKDVIDKIHYVHVHRNNGWRNGLTDHWPILPDCRELKALRTLLKMKYDIGVILEINEKEEIDESLGILKALREEIKVTDKFF